MTHHEIVTHLFLTYPSENIFEITMTTVISATVRRMGEEALELSAEDLKLAREEVKAQLSITWMKGISLRLVWTAGKLSGTCNHPPLAVLEKLRLRGVKLWQIWEGVHRRHHEGPNLP